VFNAISLPKYLALQNWSFIMQLLNTSFTSIERDSKRPIIVFDRLPSQIDLLAANTSNYADCLALIFIEFNLKLNFTQ
jgi:hypothetical protein